MKKIEDWLKMAREKVAALDAELIALKVFGSAGSRSGVWSNGMGGFVGHGSGEGFAGAADRSWLVAHGDEEVSEGALGKAEGFLRRRAEGEPLAYILGEREFYGREFKVSPEVLIPRPETEGLIELVKELFSSGLPAGGGLEDSGVLGCCEGEAFGRGLRFLEVGTGSGCIAVTLALEFPGASVVATDVSEGALEVAEENCGKYGGRVEFCQGDLLEGLPEDLRGFDVLVANLPYVDEGWEWLDKRTLRYEPAGALYAGDGGLALYKKLIRQVRERGGSGFAKYAVFEADPCQQEDLIRFAESQGMRLLKAEGFGVALGMA